MQGQKVGDKTFKVHLDGYNLTARCWERHRQPAQGVLLLERRRRAGRPALRPVEDRLHGAARHGFDVWQEPFVTLARAEALQPPRRSVRAADQEGMGYGRWRIDRVFLLVPAQAIRRAIPWHFQGVPAPPAGGQFSLDAVLQALQTPGGSD